MKDTTFQSSAYGKRENVDTTIDGRVMFDMLPYFFRNHKLSSYSLNSVSAEFLGQQKVREHRASLMRTVSVLIQIVLCSYINSVLVSAYT
jgi:DNA polymerase delta subunit 1